MAPRNKFKLRRMPFESQQMLLCG